MFILILQYAAIGATAGLFAGLLGVGGGIVIVPALVYVFSQQPELIPHSNMMHVIIGTSLAAILPTTLFSLRAQIRRRKVDLSLFKLLAPGIFMGTIMGALLSMFLHTHTLKMLFAFFILAISIQMFFSSDGPVTRKLTSTNRWAGSLAIGTASSLLGIAGGSIMTPWLNYFNIPLRQAIAASTACGVIIALTGTASYIFTGLNASELPKWSTGYIYWPAVFSIAIFSPVFAYLGVAISYKLPVKTLKNIFAIFVFIVGLKMLF